MTKTELIKSIAEQTGQTRAAIGYMLDAQEFAVCVALGNGETATIPGVVKLTTKDRAARVGRNPRTGEAMHIPAKRVVVARYLGAQI